MKKLFLFVTSLMLFISYVPRNVNAQDKKQVMTTFYPVYYLASRIAGDAAEVQMLLDGGQDAHSYEASAQDVVAVQESDLFIYQDDEMEFFVEDLINIINTDNTLILKSTEGLELLDGEGHAHDEDDHEHNHEEEDHDHNQEEDHDHNHEEEDHEHNYEEDDHGHDENHEHNHEDDDHHDHGHSHESDPHTWLDPLFYAEQAKNVEAALIALDPDNQEIYESNTLSLIEDLETLNQEYETALADLEDRTIVVQHQAFGYLAHAYNLEQIAITGLQTNQEPSAQVLAQMQDYVSENNIEVIYVDLAMSTSISETIAQATNAELRPLRTLEIVTPDERESGIDYLSIMRDNLEQLIK